MHTGPLQLDEQRAIENLDVWEIEPATFKIYGLLATARTITETMVATARRFLSTDVLARIHAMGDSNNLGFVIIHPGDAGVSISAHWWVQGSVLCQHIHRQSYDAAAPMDTVNRPVVACVWELDIIQAEQTAWRATMMRSEPNPTDYLKTRASNRQKIHL